MTLHIPPTPAGIRGAIASKTAAADRDHELVTHLRAQPDPRDPLDLVARASERADRLRAEVVTLAEHLHQSDNGRCGARCRTKDGAPCEAPRVKGKRRCKLHGGLSTGPTTDAGRARARAALEVVNARRLLARHATRAA